MVAMDGKRMLLKVKTNLYTGTQKGNSECTVDPKRLCLHLRFLRK